MNIFLEKCKNEKVNAPYLSKIVYEELIEIMGKYVQDDIVNQINNLDTKYYSITVDSIPDLTHVDQLVIVVPYCYNGKPCERFLRFLPIEKHSSMTLFNKIQQVLGEHKLSLQNIHGQPCDNASSMKGSEKGLQALIKTLKGMQTMYHGQPIPSTLLEKRQCLLYLKLLTILAFAGAVCFLFWISKKMGDFKHTG